MVPRIEFRWAILATLICLIVGWFYWFEYRPVTVSKACALEAKEHSINVLVAQIKTGEFTGLVAGDEKLTADELQKKYKDYGDDEVQNDEFRRCLEEHGLKGSNPPLVK